MVFPDGSEVKNKNPVLFCIVPYRTVLNKLELRATSHMFAKNLSRMIRKKQRPGEIERKFVIDGLGRSRIS